MEPTPPEAGKAGEASVLPEAAPCPFCDGSNTHLVNPFGGQLSVAQYWCRDCRTAFEFIKWDDYEE
ncbi:MAG TPA: hypothetical protein VFQ45_02815 [Longimicrobium sp.]|nr:hypothetical protein [Longimicrobium sp.]